MTYTVYHYDMTRYTCILGKWYITEAGAFVQSDGPRFPEEYTEVAKVEADSIDEVFKLTNTITHPWPDNEQVTTDGNYRSTSVGDIVQSANGVHRCDSFGWSEL